MIDQAVSQIKDEEGRVAYVYQDSLGKWTIGDGILVDNRYGGKLLPEEMDFITTNRVRIAIKELNAAVPWAPELDDARYAALLNMAYQLGVPKLMGFKNMLEALHDKRYDVVHDEALDSSWAKQTPERAKRMALQLATGQWQWKVPHHGV